MYEPLVTAGPAAAPRRFLGRLNMWERALLGVGSAAGGLLGCCWMPGWETHFSVGSAGAADAQGAVGPVLCRGQPARHHPADPWLRFGRTSRQSGAETASGVRRRVCFASTARAAALPSATRIYLGEVRVVVQSFLFISSYVTLPRRPSALKIAANPSRFHFKVSILSWLGS